MTQRTVELVSLVGKWGLAFLVLSYPIGTYLGQNETQQFGISVAVFGVALGVTIASALTLLIDRLRNG